MTLSGGNLSFPGPTAIAADASFVISTTFPITVNFSDGSVAGTRKVSITGGAYTHNGTTSGGGTLSLDGVNTTLSQSLSNRFNMGRNNLGHLR